MEPPVSLEEQQIRDEKCKVLRAVTPVRIEDVVVGQYTEGAVDCAYRAGYRQEPGVPTDSRTPTFCSALLRVENRRWAGVPFYMTAGKGLKGRHTLIELQYRCVPGSVFARAGQALTPNKLVIRVQPDEAILFRINTKVPGLDMKLADKDLNLQYKAAFNAIIPDAYESLLLDVVVGDRSLFIRSDILEASWDIWDPVLRQLETNGVEPAPYPFGSEGPDAAREMAERHGVAELTRR